MLQSNKRNTTGFTSFKPNVDFNLEYMWNIGFSGTEIIEFGVSKCAA